MVAAPWQAFGLRRAPTPGIESLESAWVACFGARPRAPQWLRTKLYREAWRPDLSLVLVDDAAEVAAFFLIGEGSPGALHGIGLGVRPEWRKQGIGQMLLNQAGAGLTAASDPLTLCCEVEPPAQATYVAAGFTELEARTHLLAFARGRGRGTPLPGRIPDDAQRFWYPRCWARTPESRRASFLVGPHGVGLTREPGAWLVHWSTFESLEATADAALECVDEGEPVLLYGIALSHVERASLLAAAWRPVQAHSLMQWAGGSLG